MILSYSDWCKAEVAKARFTAILLAALAAGAFTGRGCARTLVIEHKIIREPRRDTLTLDFAPLPPSELNLIEPPKDTDNE